jgi:hypothetical protein
MLPHWRQDQVVLQPAQTNPAAPLHPGSKSHSLDLAQRDLIEMLSLGLSVNLEKGAMRPIARPS